MNVGLEMAFGVLRSQKLPKDEVHVVKNNH